MSDGIEYGRRLFRGEKITLGATTEEDLPVFAQWWQMSELSVLQQRQVRPRPSGVVDDDVLIGHVTLHGIALPDLIGTIAVIIGPEHVGI